MARQFTSSSTEHFTGASAAVSGHPVTVSCHFYADSSTTDHTLWFIGDGGSNSDYFRCRPDSSNNLVYRARSSGPNSLVVASTNAFTDQVWSHACGVFGSGTSHRIWLDGTETVGATSPTITPVAWDRTTIGYFNSSSPSNPYNGRICEFGVWDVALEDDEILALRYYAPPLIRPQSLVWYNDMLRGEGDLVNMYGDPLTLTENGAIETVGHAPIIKPASPLYIFPPAAGGEVKAITASVSASSSATGVLDRIASMVASVSGASSATAVLDAIRSLVAAADGTSTVTATLGKVLASTPITAQADGASSVTATLAAIRSIVAQADGSSSATAVLVEIAALIAQADATSSVTGMLTAVAENIEAITATVSGASAVTADLDAIRSLVSQSDSTSTVTAGLVAVRALTAGIDATSTMDATFGAIRPMTATVAGLSSIVSAVLDTGGAPVFKTGITDVFTIPGGGSTLTIPGGGSTFTIPG